MVTEGEWSSKSGFWDGLAKHFKGSISIFINIVMSASPTIQNDI